MWAAILRIGKGKHIGIHNCNGGQRNEAVGTDTINGPACFLRLEYAFCETMEKLRGQHNECSKLQNEALIMRLAKTRIDYVYCKTMRPLPKLACGTANRSLQTIGKVAKEQRW